MDDQLKPCPFCGGVAELWTPTICLGDDDADVDYMQICCGCGVTGPRHRFLDHNRRSANFTAVKAHAIDKWNTRHDPDQAWLDARDAEFDDRWNARMNP